MKDVFQQTEPTTFVKTNAQYTPPMPTRQNCRVASRQRCEQNLQLAHDDCRRIRSTIWKLTMVV